MAGTSNGTGSIQEYVVKAPQNAAKKFNIMKFRSDQGIDFKSWKNAKMEREDNAKVYKSRSDNYPTQGAGSEFGLHQKEEAWRKKYGIYRKEYKAEDQPWTLTVNGKDGRKFKGSREGGISDNSSLYIFMQGKDGSFEAYPAEEWYTFRPVGSYKHLSAEEAEKHYEKREKILNYYTLMKKSKEGDEKDDDDGPRKTSLNKDLVLSELDSWMIDDSDEDNDDNEEDFDAGKRKRREMQTRVQSKKGGKNRKNEDGSTEDECIEESDEFDDGAEHDYISSDSSVSLDDEVVREELAGVDEAAALKNLLCSEDEEEEEEEEKKPELEDTAELELGKKHKKTSGKAGNEDLGEKASDDIDKTANIKEEVAEGSMQNFKSDVGVTEQSIRRYLMRKPITTTDLLTKIKQKRTGLDSDKLVTTVAKILKKINPVKRMVQGKLYLSLRY